MTNRFNKIFKKHRSILIGVIHFPPLLGYPDFPGLKIALKNALTDLHAFEKGGVDAVCFENNYDVPHKISVGQETVSAMTVLAAELKRATKLPIGISVLWNDYRAALSIAKSLDLQFIRVPVFVDKVKTDYGIVAGNPRAVRKFQKTIDAEAVLLLTDVHVKHAKLLSKYSLIQSTKLAIKHGADAVIITGRWTGDPPQLQPLIDLRKKIGNFPILIGSGLDSTNAKELLSIANGAIVSTSLKRGERKAKEINVKSYNQRIDTKKVATLRRISP